MSIEILDWYNKLDNDLDYITEDRKIEFAVNLEKFMERRDISRSDLAAKVETSPAYVTKVLRGDGNLTMETMVKFTHAVGGCLQIQITENHEDVQWMGVVRSKPRATSKNIVWAKQVEEKSNVIPGAA